MRPPPPDTPDPLLFRSDRPEPERPLLVTGLRGWGLLGGAGEFSWVRETRGAPFDWSGVYVQGMRLTGPWQLTLRSDGSTIELPSTLEEVTAYRSHVESRHRADGLEVRQTVVVPPELRGVARRLEITSSTGRDRTLTLSSAIAPVISPVLVEGLHPTRYQVQNHRGHPRLRALGSNLLLYSEPEPSSIFVDDDLWTGWSAKRRVERLRHEVTLPLPAGGTAAVTLFAWGGFDRHLGDRTGGIPGLVGCERWRTEAESTWRLWQRGTPRMRLPDAPEIERGYLLARGALRALYCHPVPELQGLRAGYPWYADLWGRDLAWMLPAVLWMNDSDWAEASLRSFFSYQSPARLPLLAASLGELPMQLSPGTVLLYGTSDTSLYYFDRVRRLAAHTGELARIAKEFRPRLELLERWFRAKSDPADGLVTNGGEIDGMREATAQSGRVTFGIDSPDTTIWDSADRRDHAIDLQVLAYEAELARADLWPGFGDDDGGAAARAHAAAIAELVRSRYTWPEERYLYDSLKDRGPPSERVRPNALLAVIAGCLPPDQARGVVRRAAEEDLTTPWGLRTLSNRDPGYDPRSYHEGQVWPIATAWAAAAALSVGEPELGVGYLRTLSRSLAAEGGLANECYHGDRPEPWDSCCLLGFSVGPFLTTLFESLWGLRPDLPHDRLAVRPAFPESFRSAHLENLRLGSGPLHLDYAPGTITATWLGRRPLTLVGPSGAVDVAPGAVEQLSL